MLGAACSNRSVREESRARGVTCCRSSAFMGQHTSRFTMPTVPRGLGAAWFRSGAAAEQHALWAACCRAVCSRSSVLSGRMLAEQRARGAACSQSNVRAEQRALGAAETRRSELLNKSACGAAKSRRSGKQSSVLSEQQACVSARCLSCVRAERELLVQRVLGVALSSSSVISEQRALGATCSRGGGLSVVRAHGVACSRGSLRPEQRALGAA